MGDGGICPPIMSPHLKYRGTSYVLVPPHFYHKIYFDLLIPPTKSFQRPYWYHKQNVYSLYIFSSHRIYNIDDDSEYDTRADRGALESIMHNPDNSNSLVIES